MKLKAVVSVEEGYGAPAFYCEPELASEIVSATFWLGVMASYIHLIATEQARERRAADAGTATSFTALA